MAVTYRIELVDGDGGSTVVEVAGDETVLAAAEAAAMSLPFGCRTGACASCTGKLLEGTVEHRKPPLALKDHHLAAGYVLPCIAEPRSDCRLRIGPAVPRELVENPWR